MTITLTALDLVQPNGELANSYFPDADLDDHLAGWLARATVQVEGDSDIAASAQNDAAEAWVYYLAYKYIANRLGSMPNTTSIGSGEIVRVVAQDRPAYWLGRAAAQLAAYQALIVPAEATTITPRDSLSVPVQLVW